MEEMAIVVVEYNPSMKTRHGMQGLVRKTKMIEQR